MSAPPLSLRRRARRIAIAPFAARHRAGRGAQRGQSLVEFALVLVPLLLILMGIIQFGFIFNTYVTLSNGVREAARDGSIYVYDQACTKDQNDYRRNERIRLTLLSSVNLLRTGSPQFATTAAASTDCNRVGGAWTTAGSTTSGISYQNGDLVVTYGPAPGLDGSAAASALSSNSRRGQAVTVRANYHQDLIVPLIAAFLPRDQNGRLGIAAEVTMVIN